MKKEAGFRLLKHKPIWFILSKKHDEQPKYIAYKTYFESIRYGAP